MELGLYAVKTVGLLNDSDGEVRAEAAMWGEEEVRGARGCVAHLRACQSGGRDGRRHHTNAMITC